MCNREILSRRIDWSFPRSSTTIRGRSPGGGRTNPPPLTVRVMRNALTGRGLSNKHFLWRLALLNPTHPEAVAGGANGAMAPPKRPEGGPTYLLPPPPKHQAGPSETRRALWARQVERTHLTILAHNMIHLRHKQTLIRTEKGPQGAQKGPLKR